MIHNKSKRRREARAAKKHVNAMRRRSLEQGELIGPKQNYVGSNPVYSMHNASMTFTKVAKGVPWVRL